MVKIIFAKNPSQHLLQRLHFGNNGGLFRFVQLKQRKRVGGMCTTEN